MDVRSTRASGAEESGLMTAGSVIEAPRMVPMFRSASTPDGQPSDTVKQIPPRLPRSLSAEALFRPHAMDTKETHSLVQELAYHTNSSYKQLQELCQRLNCFDDNAEETQFSTPYENSSTNTSPLIQASASNAFQPSVLELPEADTNEAPSDSDVALAAVLAEFGLSARPDALRAQLRERLRPKVRRHGSRQLTPKLTMELAPALSRGTSSNVGTPSRTPSGVKLLHSQSGRLESGINSRMAVRLQISRFLQEPRNRVRVLTHWKNEAASLPAVQQLGSWLVDSRSDRTLRRYRALYEAFEAMFSNMLDENDSPIRKVLFDLMSREAKRSDWTCPRDDRKAMPPQAEGTRRAVQCFRDAVLKVRSSPSDDALPSEKFEKNQWDDCLSRLNSQFEQAFEETFRRAWPQAEMAFGVIPDEEGKPVVSPLESLKRTLVQNVDNADLFCAASRSIASSADAFERDSSQTPEQWSTYLRQAITVSKNFLELAREMTLLTGLWTLGHGVESEHLSNTVLRQEYKRVCRGFANLLLQRQREILENWSERIAKELPDEVYVGSLPIHTESKEGRRLRQKILGAIVDWWRTQKSGMLRYACIDVVTLHMKKIDVKPDSPTSGGSSGSAKASEQLEQILAVMLLFKDVALEVLRREVAVRDGLLSIVDEPRVLDIMSRLMHELRDHFISEWHIALAERLGDDVLPPSKLFQAPNWKRGNFDREAAKTAFLGTIIQNRYVVTRYIHRGSMGRVWQVEEKGNLERTEPFPLCLKTFYTEDECEEMSGLRPNIYATCVLAELSQVERWMTSSTRVAQSRHLVRVVKVFRKAAIVRQGADGDGRIQGSIHGILMEYCDKGELTSYLMDSNEETCKPFDEPTAQFLFKQLADLLIELFAPPPLLASFNSDSSESSLNALVHFSNNLISPLLPIAKAMPGTQSLSSVASFAEFATLDEEEPLERRIPLRTAWDEAESPNSLRKLSLSPPTPLAQPRLLREKTVPLKYFHNDIKTENLVLSGTTLKLIDFQSLKPLRPSQMSRSEVKHATFVYSHRQEQALGTSIEAQAEGTAVWACGVILVSLLAPELNAPSWVYHHCGLGSQKELEKHLHDGHCLLQLHDSRGVRDLLEKIFSKERTPSIEEVWHHPWVEKARELQRDRSATEEVARKLLLRAPEASDPKSAYVAWVPLRNCVLQVGKPAPFDDINEIVEMAISFSGKPYPKFSLEKHRVIPGQATSECRAVEEDDQVAEEDEFHEWCISMCISGIDEEYEGSDNEVDEDASTFPGLGDDPQRDHADDTPSPHLRKDSRTLSHMSSSATLTGPRRPQSLWKLMRIRMASDRFVVQVRPRKDNATEEDPTGIWWLRVKWLPPVIGLTKSATSDTRRSFFSNMQAGGARFVQSSNFMQLQHLLFEGLNEVQERRRLEEQRRLEQRRRAQAPRGKSVGLMLPSAAFG